MGPRGGAFWAEGARRVGVHQGKASFILSKTGPLQSLVNRVA